MEVLEEEASTVQEQSLEADVRVIQLVKSEILKSIAFALRLEAAGLREVLNLNAPQKIDFYKEVEHFEINLIKQALIRMQGNQRAAAKLLGLNATTLNSKIKHYRIEV